MSFFKPQFEPEVIFEDLQSIEFEGKVFHLSGTFKEKKAEFSKSISECGGIARGFSSDKNLRIKDTHCLVLADKGIKIKGQQYKPYGKNAMKIQRHNEKVGNRHIPIIKESVCIRLMMRQLHPTSTPSKS
jgi:hypothetical protein